MISDYLIREGQFNLEQIFEEESKLKENSSEFIKSFQRLHRILESIHQKNLEPVISWVEENREKFNEYESKLLFFMHKLQVRMNNHFEFFFFVAFFLVYNAFFEKRERSSN